jgi:hypothetical protein
MQVEVQRDQSAGNLGARNAFRSGHAPHGPADVWPNDNYSAPHFRATFNCRPWIAPFPSKTAARENPLFAAWYKVAASPIQMAKKPGI